MYENQKQYQQEKNLQYTTYKDRVAAVFHNGSFTSESIHLKTEEISALNTENNVFILLLVCHEHIYKTCCY